MAFRLHGVRYGLPGALLSHRSNPKLSELLARQYVTDTTASGSTLHAGEARIPPGRHCDLTSSVGACTAGRFRFRPPITVIQLRGKALACSRLQPGAFRSA